ncbi:MAG: DUF3472 domain-containing protein [Muribaculaceae bacterium]|nr:DUF3472 domain-containing protein [Muribaculaceae bacterium]
MKFFWLTALLLLTTLFAQSETVAIGLSGNGYVTNHRDGARITESGLADWTNPGSDISVYFYLQEPTKTNISILAKGHSEIKVSYGKKDFKVKLNSDQFTQIPVGRIDVKKPGHVRIDFRGIKKQGKTFGEIKQVILDNVSGECNYITEDFSDYFGRRGPSVHIAYKLPEGDTEWFYNEVTVPEDGEVMQSYYMADGFGEGYFGMQYNSPTERRILFSVWSPFVTEDPREIPEDQKIKLLRRGKDVYIGEFGNEGSGGQSYLNYPWKTGHTYKFLMQVTPDGNDNTIYTAYFYSPDDNEWRLIASFLRPHTNTWYKHAHSFLENFSPEQGYLSREVYFGNQWARSKDGKWTPLTEATFTNDATAQARVRLDYQGGNTDDNRYYLKMGGFFDESVPRGTKFHITPAGQAPEIDWEALKKL